MQPQQQARPPTAGPGGPPHLPPGPGLPGPGPAGQGVHVVACGACRSHLQIPIAVRRFKVRPVLLPLPPPPHARVTPRPLDRRAQCPHCGNVSQL